MPRHRVHFVERKESEICLKISHGGGGGSVLIKISLLRVVVDLIT
jgi:hypothetical protein